MRRLTRILEHAAAAFALPALYLAIVVVARPLVGFVFVTSLAACAAAAVIVGSAQ